MDVLALIVDVVLEACYGGGVSDASLRGVVRTLMGIAGIVCVFAAVASAFKSGGWMWLAFAITGIVCFVGVLALRE